MGYIYVMDNKRIIRLFINLISVVALVIFDQYTKLMAIKTLKGKPPISLIDGVFQLCYLENKGAAFGMLQGQKLFFIIVAITMILFILYVLVKLPTDNKYILLDICLCMISAGAVGNMIDRVTTNYVVDFFYFVLINFPIFNMADIYVTVSCIILIIAMIFYYNEDDFKFLARKKRDD